LTTKIHALVDALGNPVEVMLTAGQDHDLTCAEPLIEAVDPAALIADKAFDADAFITALTERAITPVIPSKSNRSTPRRCDFALYCERNLIDIDQAWRLSRLCGGDGGFVGRFRRQAAPGRRGGADRLQRRDRLGIGAHKHAAFRAGADVAAG